MSPALIKAQDLGCTAHGRGGFKVFFGSAFFLYDLFLHLKQITIRLNNSLFSRQVKINAFFTLLSQAFITSNQIQMWNRILNDLVTVFLTNIAKSMTTLRLHLVYFSNRVKPISTHTIADIGDISLHPVIVVS